MKKPRIKRKDIITIHLLDQDTELTVACIRREVTKMPWNNDGVWEIEVDSTIGNIWWNPMLQTWYSNI